MKYDIIIPIGCSCVGAQALREAKKRRRSLPFDWIGPTSLEKAVTLLENHFEGFFQKENMQRDREKDTKKNIGYLDTGSNLLFLHDFKDENNFDEEFELLKEKYNRRIDRLYETTKDLKDILYLYCFAPKWFDGIMPSDEEIKTLFARLCALNPGKKPSLLFINLSEESGDVCAFRKISEQIDFCDCYKNSEVPENDDFLDYYWYRGNLQTILKKYGVKTHLKDYLKKILYKTLDALGHILPNGHLRSKLRMLYKEYK